MPIEPWYTRGTVPFCSTRGGVGMGWAVRHDGRRYLYRNRRVNGMPVKEYLATDDAFGEIMADELDHLRQVENELRPKSTYI